MFRFVASAVVVLFAVTVVMAEEFVGVITKFEDGKVTFKKGFGKKGGDQKPEEKTLPVAANVKYMKAKFNIEDKKFEVDGELPGGKDAFAKQVEAPRRRATRAARSSAASAGCSRRSSPKAKATRPRSPRSACSRPSAARKRRTPINHNDPLKSQLR
jgi:hypothetical protein